VEKLLSGRLVLEPTAFLPLSVSRRHRPHIPSMLGTKHRSCGDRSVDAELEVNEWQHEVQKLPVSLR